MALLKRFRVSDEVGASCGSSVVELLKVVSECVCVCVGAGFGAGPRRAAPRGGGGGPGPGQRGV